MPLIACTNAAFGYNGNTVVDKLNFTLNHGNYLCVVGENGAGKSTLVKGVLGLLRPIQGSIDIAKQLKQNEIGYLPQQTAAQKNFPASVEEVVHSGFLNRRRFRILYNQDEKQTALKLMQRLGIHAIRKQSYSLLSGGQQQRVLLARALCATQRLLLLDEPATGLDPVATADFYRLIAEINKDMGVTVLMVSHDVHSAVKYASHILHLQHNQRFFGTATDYANCELGQGFLGVQNTNV